MRRIDLSAGQGEVTGSEDLQFQKVERIVVQ